MARPVRLLRHGGLGKESFVDIFRARPLRKKCRTPLCHQWFVSGLWVQGGAVFTVSGDDMVLGGISSFEGNTAVSREAMGAYVTSRT